MTKVKICGITSIEDAISACQSGADMLGFNFYIKSPRYIDPQSVAGIIDHLPVNVVPIGVFVDHSAHEINTIVRTSGVRVVQLHGEDMDSDEIKQIQYPLIKAFRIYKDFNAGTIRSFHLRHGATTFLIDAFEKGAYGGTGKQIKQEQAKTLVKSISDFGFSFLAGGLTPDNVKELVQEICPYGVDVASGVESFPGKKDHLKTKVFIKNAKKAGLSFGS